MAIVADLLAKPGVVAAGEYTYKAEPLSYEGQLDPEAAQLLAVMGHATTLGTQMEGDMLRAIDPDSKLLPVRGWILRGPQYALCVMANVYCLVDSRKKDSLNRVVAHMRQALRDASMELV
ncbi:MAG: DUF2173 family protein [Candidatus Competibacteraceae bacterium]|nr:DUF2173 family protein [Candidatus Competibacteraceae bacterium]